MPPGSGWVVVPEHLDALAQRFGLIIEHSPKVGYFLRAAMDIVMGSDPTGCTAEKPFVLVPDDEAAAAVCGHCCRLLPAQRSGGRTVSCITCPLRYRYCGPDCRDSDRCHRVACVGRSAEAALLARALEGLRAYLVIAQRPGMAAVRLAVRFCLEAIASRSSPFAFPFLQPTPYHGHFAADPEEQPYNDRLRAVHQSLLDACFGPKSAFQRFGPPPWLSFPNFAALCSMMQCNAFEITLGEDEDDSAPSGAAVFALHSLVNHSCIPNCWYVSAMVPAGPPYISLHPLRSIPRGEELTITYVAEARLAACRGVVGRRALICATRRFLCHCTACGAEAAAIRPRLTPFVRFDAPQRLLDLPRGQLRAGLLVAYVAANRPPPPSDRLQLLTPKELAAHIMDAISDHIRLGG